MVNMYITNNNNDNTIINVSVKHQPSVHDDDEDEDIFHTHITHIVFICPKQPDYLTT